MSLDSATLSETAARAREVVAAAEARKAIDLRVLRLTQVSDLTDFFLICSGRNPRQVKAIADAVDEKLRAGEVRPLHVEGYNNAQWVLMDYGDVVVHIFDEDRRGFYGLDRLWADAPDVTEEFRP